LPPLTKDSRAPGLLKPSVSVVASTPVTCAFWVSNIQARRRRLRTALTTSGHNRRTSTSDRPPAGAPCGSTGAELSWLSVDRVGDDWVGDDWVGDDWGADLS